MNTEQTPPRAELPERLSVSGSGYLHDDNGGCIALSSHLSIMEAIAHRYNSHTALARERDELLRLAYLDYHTTTGTITDEEFHERRNLIRKFRKQWEDENLKPKPL